MQIQLTPIWALCLFLFSQMLIFSTACTSDELPPRTASAECDTLMATYDANVKAIIDETCAYSACHSSSSATGAPGNFNSYNGVEVYLENGTFRERVFNQDAGSPLVMPPNNFSLYPQIEKDNLTEEERQIIECWLDAGFPEN